MLLICNLIFNQMKIISTNTHEIRFKDDGYRHLIEQIKRKSYTKIFVLVDENTKQYSLNLFKKKFSISFEILEIKSGEINKNINTCVGIWNDLTHNRADRNCLIINLGAVSYTHLTLPTIYSV